MSSVIKRSVARGFTLIELLIVVIILAILAAIAIPQFSSSTTDAQMAALDANLSTVRSAIEQYKVQHANVYPGAVTAALATSAKCSGGTDPTSPAAGATAMTTQLAGFTNAAGQVCPAGDPINFKYGPYLRQGLPNEPFTNVNTVTIVTVNPIVGVASGTGWAYNVTSGQFASNNANADATGSTRTFAQH